MGYFILIVCLIIADQSSKYVVLNQVGMSNQIEIIPGFFYIHCIPNNGIALGLFANRQLFVIIFTALIMLGILIYIFKNFKKDAKADIFSLSLIVGGGIGNIIDRIRLNYVIDFIDFRIWPYIFNVADICVVLGCVFLILSMLWGMKENKERT